MLKHLLYYVPAQVLPALMSLLGVAVFTHHMGVVDYGQLAIALAVVTAGQGVALQWLCASVMRFYPKAREEGTLPALLAGTGSWWLISSLLTLLGLGVASALFLPTTARGQSVMLCAALLYVTLSLAFLTMRVHMAAMHSRRYSLLQAVQSIGGMGTACLLAWYVSATPQAILLGFVLGYIFVLLVDYRNVIGLFRLHRDDAGMRHRIWQFGWPIIIFSGFSFILSKGDRFLVQALLGSEAVALYAAPYSLAEQAISVIFLIIVPVTHPLAVRAYEQGSAALAEQMQVNARVVFGLAAPAALGFAMLASEISDLILAEAYYDLSVQVLPWVALSTLMFGLKAHYLDHAFQLAHKNKYQLYILIPAAALNLLLNLILLPRIGVMGAVYATVISYALALIGSYYLAQRAFRFTLPWLDLAKITLACLLMAAVMSVIEIDVVWQSLLLKFLLGAGSYVLVVYTMGLLPVLRR